jgi:hypothetical protein
VGALDVAHGYRSPMATLSFEGETHGELVVKVRRWLASLEGEEEGHIGAASAIEQGAELTKDAVRVIAAAAPRPVADSEVARALAGMGYKATDVTRDALVAGLDQLEQLTGGSVFKTVSEKGRSAAYQMNVSIAKQILKQLHGV